MALYASTASAKTATTLSGNDYRSKSDLTSYINTYYDELVDGMGGEIDANEMLGLMREGSQKNDTHIVQTKVRGNAQASVNEDGNPIPFISWGQGWNYTFRVYPYRVGSKHTRRLEEIENYGSVAQEAKELTDAGMRTIRYAVADVFNRAISPSSAPFVCLDGMYLIDTGRPNPVPGVPAWSNQESTASITEDALFQANMNAMNTLAENGDPLRLEVQEILIPRAYEQVMWKLDKTEKLLGTANNDANWAAGRYKFRTLRDLTGNNIFYLLGSPKSEKNGLEFRWSVRPGVADIKFEDPDVMGKRLRFIFGMGCLDPRRVWRGGVLNAL
jgi:hypothetical protein